jgi:hypothetical protein
MEEDLDASIKSTNYTTHNKGLEYCSLQPAAVRTHLGLEFAFCRLKLHDLLVQRANLARALQCLLGTKQAGSSVLSLHALFLQLGFEQANL